MICFTHDLVLPRLGRNDSWQTDAQKVGVSIISDDQQCSTLLPEEMRQNGSQVEEATCNIGQGLSRSKVHLRPEPEVADHLLDLLIGWIMPNFFQVKLHMWQRFLVSPHLIAMQTTGTKFLISVIPPCLHFTQRIIFFCFGLFCAKHGSCWGSWVLHSFKLL